ncbi:MAG: hypothetical protein IPM82_19405 [Saprospiraceae bacterium]|nr:hypothetical protein [Saprospiraceae bacterium]
MNCKQGTEIIIGQMKDLLGRIAPETYAQPLQLFNGSSIGQHFRHIVDFYGCLSRGVGEGRVDYAQRQRDTRVETEADYAAKVLNDYFIGMQAADEAATVEIVADFSSDLNETRPVVLSTVGREMMYAYDHAVHHLAMIKMGLKAAAPSLEIDKNLGVAPSTVKHWNTGH